MAKKAKKTAKKRTRQRAPRITRYDRLVESTVQDHAHMSTNDIVRERSILHCAQENRELKIVELRSQLADVLREKADTDAVLFGLGVVIARR